MNILSILIFSIGFNLLMFIPAYFWRTDKLTDISYALTFAAVAVFGLVSTDLGWPSILVAAMIILWAIRLGTYLLIRIHKIKRDKRFDGMRESFWRFIRFWLLQGFTVWVVLIPSILFFRQNVAAISGWAYIGVGIWLVGILIETFADLQKYRFINNPDNKGKWIDSGLWKYSQHPNYFGEILLWIGVYVFVVFGLNFEQSLIALVGPLFIAIMIIFISGIPLLRKAAMARWGNDPSYLKYRKQTSVLMPLPPKK